MLIVKEGNILRNFHYEFDIKGSYKLRDLMKQVQYTIEISLV